MQAQKEEERLKVSQGLAGLSFEIGSRNLRSGIGAGGLLLVSKFYGQATKGTRWMPWHFEAMKDVASCDKLR